jgi:NitT/TauT family transport system substrate-binding protein
MRMSGDGTRRWWLGLLTLVALGVAPGGSVRAEDEVVRLGDLLAISNAGVYIAIEKGYFKQEQVKVDVSTFASAAKSVPALAAGELDVAVGSASAGLFNAIAQGAGFRIVADKGQAREGTGFTLLTARKDLVDSGQVKSVKDLKGRKVALLAKGNIQHYLLGKMLEEAGLTINDVELSYLNGPNTVTAFRNKAVDAAYAVEPWPARFEEQGLAVRFRTPEQVPGLGPVQIGTIIYSGKFIAERRPVAQRWMNAYLKGCEFYATRGIKDPEVLTILEKYTKVPAPVIRAATPYYQEPRGRVLVESLADQIKWFVANDLMKESIPVERTLDLSFVK